MAERNAPCPCGSGKKFKKCHLLLEHEASRQKILAERAEVVRKPTRGALAPLLGMVAAVMPPKRGW